ncbi:response regulator [Ferruginibacter sp.]
MISDETDLLTLSLLIIDDHKMVRQGFKMMLQSLKKLLSFRITEAESGEEGLKKSNRYDYDLIIIDYQLPGISGVETIYRILRHKPLTKILVLSHYDELPCIQAMMDAGAKGYVLKSIEPAEIYNAIRSVLDNKPYFSNLAALKLINSSKENSIIQLQEPSQLTPRQLEILKMIAMEMTNGEIAETLSITKRTVDTHRQNLLSKLHAKNTAGLVKAAYQLKIL